MAINNNIVYLFYIFIKYLFMNPHERLILESQLKEMLFIIFF